MPLGPNTDTRMRIHRPEYFGGLPVIEDSFAPFIPRDQELTIIAEIYGAGITSAVMRLKLLGSDSPEVTSLVFVDYYLVIRGLACQILPSRVQSSRRDGMHLGL